MRIEDVILYLVINAFHIYIFLLAYRVFFGPSKFRKRYEWLSYAAFYLLNSGAFIFLGDPFLNLATSILPLFLLTMLYHGNGRTKLLIGLFSYLGSMLFELVSLNLLQLFGLAVTTGAQILGNLMANLLLFAAVLVYKNIRQETKQRALSIVHWLTITALPSGSLVIAAFIYSEGVGAVAASIIITILIMINIVVFRLYDLLDQHYFSSYERHLLQQQNAAYLHELEIVKKSDEDIRMLRHDLKNHFSTAYQLLNSGKHDELGLFISDLSGEYLSTDRFVDTGNPEVDGILNIKLGEARRLNAELDVDVKIPQALPISSLDMNIILGNLLDNAIEAMKNSPIKRLKVHIYLDRGMLVLHICNTFWGERKKAAAGEDSFYLTQKERPETHGIGLRSIKRAVEKYDGNMTIKDANGLFDVNIVMYLP